MSFGIPMSRLFRASLNAQLRNQVSILVIGRKGVGKTNFVKIATKFTARRGRNLSDEVRSYDYPSIVEGHVVRIIDTPLFSDTATRKTAYDKIASYIDTNLKNKQITGVVYVHDIRNPLDDVLFDLAKLEEINRNPPTERIASADNQPATNEAEPNEDQPTERIDKAGLANILILCTNFDPDPKIAQIQYDNFKNNDKILQKEEDGYIFARAGADDHHEYTLQTVIKRSINKLILVMGGTGAGKTTFINTVTNSGFRAGHRLHSCTSDIKLSKPFPVKGQRIRLIDTPGLDDTEITDEDTFRAITTFLEASYQNKDQIIGVLYFHDINDTRMGRTAVRNLQMFSETVGVAAAKNVVILTTQWDRIDIEIGNKRYAELKAKPKYFGNITGLGAIMAKSWKKGEGNNDQYINILQAIIERSTEWFILVIGPTGAGKTTYIKNITESSSKPIDAPEKIRFSDAIEIGNHTVNLIDTPGIGDNDEIKMLEDVVEVLEKKKKEQIIGVVYVQDIRSPPKPSKINDMNLFKQLVGEAAAKNVVVITTKWATAEPLLGSLLEKSLKETPDFFGNKLSLDYPIMHQYPEVNGVDLLQSIIQQSVSLNEQSDFILVMGGVGTGKTKLINSITNSKLKTGDGMAKCTVKCGFSDQLELLGHSLKFIDTPGLDPDGDNEAIYKEIRGISRQLSKKGNRIIGGIYMVDPAIVNAGGPSRNMMMASTQLVAEITSGNIFILATSQSFINDKQVDELRTSSYFAPLLNEGAVLDAYQGGDQLPYAIHIIIKNCEKTEALQIQKEYVNERKQVNETKAKAILDEDIQKVINDVGAQHQKQSQEPENPVELRSSQEIKEMKTALKQAKQRKERELAERQKMLRKREESGILFGFRRFAAAATTTANPSSSLPDTENNGGDVDVPQPPSRKGSLRANLPPPSSQNQPTPLNAATSKAAAPETVSVPLVMDDSHTLLAAGPHQPSPPLSTPPQKEQATGVPSAGSQFPQPFASTGQNPPEIPSVGKYGQSRSSTASSTPPVTPNQISFSQQPIESPIPGKLQRSISLSAQVNAEQISPSLPASAERLILVMGESGSGKTNFINGVTGPNLQVGHDLEGCISEIRLSNPIQLSGQAFVLVEIPGFNDTNRTDADILMEIATFLGKSHQQKKQIAGVVYLHDITNIQMRGTAIRNIKMFKEAVGDYAANNVIIVTTKWLLVDKATGDERHNQLARSRDFFLDLIEHGAKMAKNDEVPAEEILATIIAKPLEVPLQLAYEVVDKKKKVNKTSAGGILSLDLKRTLNDAKSQYRQKEIDLYAQTNVYSFEERKRLRAEIRQAKEDMEREIMQKNAVFNQKVELS